MRAGHCVTCATPIWRFVSDAKTGAEHPLWPRPLSRYPIFSTESGNEARGIGYCLPCCPAVGGQGPPGVTASLWSDHERLGSTTIALRTCKAIEHAKDRYAFWYSAEYGVFLRAWLRDHLDMDKEQAGAIDAVMAEWARDRS